MKIVVKSTVTMTNLIITEIARELWQISDEILNIQQPESVSLWVVQFEMIIVSFVKVRADGR